MTITVLLPRWLVPVRPRREVLENMAVVIEGDLITAIVSRKQAMEAYLEASYIELPEHVLLPGFINTHSHSAMSLLRGFADDLNLQEWLNGHIWPAEKAFLGSEFVSDGSNLAIAEMLRGGTTCFNDFYFFPEQTVNAALDAGIRACIGIPVIDVPTPWAAGENECLDKGLDISASWQGESLITTALAPHAPYSVGDAALGRIAELSANRDMPVHMHVLESAWEVAEAENQHGKSTLARLNDLGLLNERLLAVHMTQLDGVDLTELADRGVNIIHCPESNLKLGSGICPLARLLDHGINVALGTDGAACNNDLDMLSESRTAALMAKGFSADPCVVDAFQALEMLTINAAIALGQCDRIGSVEAGKQADLCAIRLDSLRTTPMYDVVSHLIYAASSQQVSHVWVAGRMLLEDQEFLHMDVSDIMDRARHWAERITAGVSN
ncbi:MAG: TRZ/ATZ family hydrolase [Xanthomonadales bacterium]|nr:TRZ/ATZ family hydrolase [Xanthomonadales bacterium]